MTQTPHVVVFNQTKIVQVLKAMDGTSVHVHARTRTKIHHKFDWSLPKGVKVVKDNRHLKALRPAKPQTPIKMKPAAPIVPVEPITLTKAMSAPPPQRVETPKA
jgi:hypothetical protein